MSSGRALAPSRSPKRHRTAELRSGPGQTDESGERTAWLPRDELVAALEESQRRGAIGPGAVAEHIAHALAFAEACPEIGFVDTVLDLGAGGGLPGLVLATRFNRPHFVLLDGRTERAVRLRADAEALSLQERVCVLGERAEIAGRRKDLRGRVDVVVARSFGRPSVTAECASPFLRQGSALIVSGPPGAPGDRWPESPLRELGLAVELMIANPRSFTVLRRIGPCPERYPRRVGVPEKRPLF